MSSAIWTVILQKGEEFNSLYEYASRDVNQARKEICQKYPRSTVVALILGRHTGTYTFDVVENSGYEYYEHGENQPTGGSD